MRYGRYEIVQEVGKGAMGVVYRAHDPQIDRTVALKVLRQDRVTSEDLVQRFLKEAKAIGRLSHPNIVTVYDVGHDQGTIYIAMEFLEGTPLNEIIKQGNVSLDTIIDLGTQMAGAVDYAHSKGIVHRDIKPTNIIVKADGQVKITDFGIARIEDPSATQQTQAGEILGTPVYMSPEQVMGKTVDGRSDLYSLGVILYELGTGTRPFGGNNLAAIFRAITQDVPADPITVNPSLPQSLSDLVIKSLDKNPEKRFQTGKAMATALKRCIASQGTSEVPAQPEERPRSRMPLLLGLAIIVLVAVGAVSYSLFSGPRPENNKPSDLAVSAQALLKVQSAPAGAQVYVDGVFKGKSPLNLELPLGKHEVRMNLPDHYEWEAQLQLREAGETPLFVRLIPMEANNP
ncbi:MAG: serine/threonine protein kinase [Deltaproteobacteria bacterium]|nr:serine/threonine protein kinase [Deltaproteobacteria bacterium]